MTVIRVSQYIQGEYPQYHLEKLRQLSVVEFNEKLVYLPFLGLSNG